MISWWYVYLLPGLDQGAMRKGRIELISITEGSYHWTAFRQGYSGFRQRKFGGSFFSFGAGEIGWAWEEKEFGKKEGVIFGDSITYQGYKCRRRLLGLPSNSFDTGHDGLLGSIL